MKEEKKERKKENTRKLVLLALVVNVLLYGSWHLNVLTVWLNDNSLNRGTMPSSWSTINNCRVNQYLSAVSQNTCCLTLSSLADYNLCLSKLAQNLTSAKKCNFMLTFCTDCEKQKQKIRRLKEKRKEKMVSRRCLSPSIKLFKSNKLFSRGHFILLQFSQLKQ